ncbi:MAG: YigZ family protein [Flavobacteriaceae bacterium]|nr:YigZ family protein [Flavobacteriaceae bacterium]
MTPNIQDVYKTIKDPSTEVLFKDRGSKFFAYAYPVKTIEQVQEVLDHIKSLHPSAGHHCFAYQLGEGYEQYRVSDDGEPNHSAGTPIYGQIQSLELTNCLVVVVRYFGGTKLGVSGLVHAYKTSAAQALEHTDIIEQYITRRVVISFQYEEIGVLMRYLKTQDHRITEQHLGTPCTLTLEVRLDAMEELKIRLAQWHRMTCKILDH